MLKIHDDVDLKELEKYGFEYKEKTYVIDDFGNTRTEKYAKIEKEIILGSDYKVSCSIYIEHPNKRMGWGTIQQNMNMNYIKSLLKKHYMT